MTGVWYSSLLWKLIELNWKHYDDAVNYIMINVQVSKCYNCISHKQNRVFIMRDAVVMEMIVLDLVQWA